MLFLIHRTVESDRRASAQHSVLVEAASESAARTLCGCPDSWLAHQLAATSTMPFMTRTDGSNERLQVVKFDGDAISMLQMDRGGNNVGRDAKIV